MSGHIFPSSDGKIIAFQPENSYRQAEEGQQARSSGKIEEQAEEGQQARSSGKIEEENGVQLHWDTSSMKK